MQRCAVIIATPDLNALQLWRPACSWRRQHSESGQSPSHLSASLPRTQVRKLGAGNGSESYWAGI